MAGNSAPLDDPALNSELEALLAVEPSAGFNARVLAEATRRAPMDAVVATRTGWSARRCAGRRARHPFSVHWAHGSSADGTPVCVAELHSRRSCRRSRRSRPIRSRCRPCRAHAPRGTWGPRRRPSRPVRPCSSPWTNPAPWVSCSPGFGRCRWRRPPTTARCRCRPMRRRQCGHCSCRYWLSIRSSHLKTLREESAHETSVHPSRPDRCPDPDLPCDHERAATGAATHPRRPNAADRPGGDFALSGREEESAVSPTFWRSTPTGGAHRYGWAPTCP